MVCGIATDGIAFCIYKRLSALDQVFYQIFILYNAIPNPPQGESKNEKSEDWERQWKLIEQLKNSILDVSLSCEGYEDEHETIAMSSVGYLPTTTVQILDAINHSIIKLSSQIEYTQNDQT